MSEEYDFEPPPPDLSPLEEKSPKRRGLADAEKIKADKPTQCKLCGSRFFEGVFYDAQTKGSDRYGPGGRWMYMCVSCYKKNGKDGVKYVFNKETKKWSKEQGSETK